MFEFSGIDASGLFVLKTLMASREKIDYIPSFKKYQLSGNLLKIFTYPSPVLTKVAEAVTLFDNELETLCRDMLFTMYQAPGIGLAAPQVGINKRIFVIDLNYEREEITRADGQEDYNYSDFAPLVLINPEIKLLYGEIYFDEGCLSVPGIYEEIKRVQNIEVTYYDLKGKEKKIDATDLLSVCIQHENDHLNGIIFIDRLSFIKKDLIKKRLIKEKKRKKI